MVLAREAAGRVDRLSDIPGVGEKLAERLVEFFGSEREALRAILECRLGLLAEAVGKATATRIIHGVHKLLYGAWPRDVASNDDAWKLYTSAKEVLIQKASSKPGRDILTCMLPIPASSIEHVEMRLKLLDELVRKLREKERLDAEKLAGMLSGLEWPRPVKLGRLKRRLVIVADEEAYHRALEQLSGIVEVVYARDGIEAEEYLSEGEGLVYDPYGLYRGEALRVEEVSIESVAPEAIVEYFRVNWKTANVILEVLDYLRESDALDLLEVLGIHQDVAKRVVEARSAILALRGGDIDPSIDAEYRRLKAALDKLDRVVDEVEEWANDEIQSRLEKLEVKLTAAQFLRIFSVLREGELEGVELPEEIYEVYESVADEAEKMLVEKLDLQPDEAEAIRGVVPRHPSYRVELDREKVEELRRLLRAKLTARRFAILQELARRLRGVKDALETLVYTLAVLDAMLAEYRMISSGHACIPEVSRDYLGVGFVNALEASLLGREGVQKVSYVVGSTPYRPDDVKGERVVLLTGANSGGKTTLLRTICEIVLMAQSGLVVFAEKAWIGAFDHVYFFSKPTGMVDAGALETTLRILGAIVASERGRRLVLVDELEAATEAGAAARIMAVLVKELCADRETVAVIVTHLAREILGVLDELGGAEGCVRVDGIEARGLDENYNLIVDRNPRYYYLARSTPELVVRRLVHRARRRREKEFYQRLLEVLAEHR